MINMISNPVNSTVPIAAEILKSAGVYDKKKLFGVTTLDVVSSTSRISALRHVSSCILVDVRASMLGWLCDLYCNPKFTFLRCKGVFHGPSAVPVMLWLSPCSILIRNIVLTHLSHVPDAQDGDAQ